MTSRPLCCPHIAAGVSAEQWISKYHFMSGDKFKSCKVGVYQYCISIAIMEALAGDTVIRV